MSNTYRGDAVIVIEGTDFPVAVDLAATDTSWSGTVTAGREFTDFGPSQVHSGVLRMSDGRQRQFVIVNGEIGSRPAEIRGIGPAPF